MSYYLRSPQPVARSRKPNYFRKKTSMLKLFPETKQLFYFFSFRFYFIRTMAASALAAITTFEMVFFCKNDESFCCQVIIFFVEFIGECHFAESNLLIIIAGNC